MGTVIAGYVEMGRPILGIGSLGNVLAFFRANIDKSFFQNWINLVELQEKFPNRIELIGSMISFKGPVALISSPNAFKVSLVGLTALIGMGSYFGVYQMIKFLKNADIICLSDTTSAVISAVAASSITAAIAGLLYTSGAFSLSAGVYFL